MSDRSQRGVSFTELIIVLALISIIGLVTTNYVVSWLPREAMRGAIYQTQQAMQIARAQAIARNRKVRVIVDATGREVATIDLNDPLDLTDDILLHHVILPDTVSFARPDPGAAVTLTFVSTGLYEATFLSDGSVAGAGIVALTGGDGAYRVNLQGAGATSVERWTGSSWVAGS